MLQTTMDGVAKFETLVFRPRVRLLPFYFAKFPNNPGIKNYLTHAKAANLQNFQWYKFEEEFYDIIKQEPEFIRIKTRLLAGYFHCQYEGIEEPNADIAAMWELKKKGLHINRCYVFFVDDTYYAGDIVHDRRPDMSFLLMTPTTPVI